MKQYLWINRWNAKRKNSAINKQKVGISFLPNYVLYDFKTVLYELWQGLSMNEGSKTSMYVTFIPPSGKEVIKLRISDHQSTQDEWGRNELTGLPNRRYSIVLFSKKSMPTESKQGIKELKWKSYMAQKIPVYEKAFNRYYLHETFNTLKTILLSIYQGGCPEDRSIPINLNENKQYKYNRNNMKRKIRLNESDLHRIVKESVDRMLNEDTWYEPNPHKFTDELENALNRLKKDAYSVYKIALKESQLPNTNVTENVKNTIYQIFVSIDNLSGKHFTNSDVY